MESIRSLWFLRRMLRHAVAGWFCASAMVGYAVAQDAPLSRFPADGLALVNCAPAEPAPQDTCTVRVPPGYEVTGLQAEGLEGAQATFQFLRQESADFPTDLTLSSTLLLVDLSPGPGDGRRATWAREKALIETLVEGLPDDELVAIYGFAEDLALIQDFTTNTSDLRAAVDELELGGTNTLIGTFVGSALDILAEQDTVLHRNIILVSDGEDEGGQAADEVARSAASANVIVSSFGTYWRSAGSSATGPGIAYNRALADGTQGLKALVPLRNPAAAQEATEEFTGKVFAARRASGLISPVGTPVAANISVVVRSPVPGSETLSEQEVNVRFDPASSALENDPVEEDGGGDWFTDTLFGYPAIYVYGAAVGVAVLLLGLFLALGRTRNNTAEATSPTDLGPGEFEPQSTTGWPISERTLDDASFRGFAEPGEPFEATHPPEAPISAYLIFDGPIGRQPLRGTRANIGRSATNDIVVDIDGMSRLHAQIHKNRDGGFSITDLDSLNGTYVNDKKVDGTMPVGLSDTIAFGKVRAKLTSP